MLHRCPPVRPAATPAGKALEADGARTPRTENYDCQAKRHRCGEIDIAYAIIISFYDLFGSVAGGLSSGLGTTRRSAAATCSAAANLSNVSTVGISNAPFEPADIRIDARIHRESLLRQRALHTQSPPLFPCADQIDEALPGNLGNETPLVGRNAVIHHLLGETLHPFWRFAHMASIEGRMRIIFDN